MWMSSVHPLLKSAVFYTCEWNDVSHMHYILSVHIEINVHKLQFFVHLCGNVQSVE